MRTTRASRRDGMGHRYSTASTTSSRYPAAATPRARDCWRYRRRTTGGVAAVKEGKEEEKKGRKLTLADRFSPGSPEFAFLRRRASYIADSPIGLLRALAEVLKNLIASLLLVFLVAVIVGWVFGWFVARLPLAAIVPWRHAAPPEPVHLQALDHSSRGGGDSRRDTARVCIDSRCRRPALRIRVDGTVDHRLQGRPQHGGGCHHTAGAPGSCGDGDTAGTDVAVCTASADAGQQAAVGCGVRWSRRRRGLAVRSDHHLDGHQEERRIRRRQG